MTMHSGVGLLCWAMHVDPSVYKSCFLLSQTDTKNRLLYCTKSYIHRLLTYLAFLLNKMQFYRKCCHKERLQNYSEEGLPSNSPKQLVSGNHNDISYITTSRKKYLNIKKIFYSITAPQRCNKMSWYNPTIFWGYQWLLIKSIKHTRRYLENTVM